MIKRRPDLKLFVELPKGEKVAQLNVKNNMLIAKIKDSKIVRIFRLVEEENFTL